MFQKHERICQKILIIIFPPRTTKQVIWQKSFLVTWKELVRRHSTISARSAVYRTHVYPPPHPPAVQSQADFQCSNQIVSFIIFKWFTLFIILPTYHTRRQSHIHFRCSSKLLVFIMFHWYTMFIIFHFDTYLLYQEVIS